MSTPAHSIDWDGVKVLDREAKWFKRGVKEAIQIKRRGSNLNRDKGRHQLPPAFDSILSSDQPPSTSGQMTQNPGNRNSISRH